MNNTSTKKINPFQCDEFFHLVWYNESGRIHYIYQESQVRISKLGLN